MIARNGIRSTLRAKGRTALFALLILALTLSLALGLGMWAYSGEMLARCDEGYTSIALVEYMGSGYPDGNAADPYVRQAADLLDGGALAALDGVERWEANDRALAAAEGYERQAGIIPYENSAVLEGIQFRPMYETQWTQMSREELPEEFCAIDWMGGTCELHLRWIKMENMMFCWYDGTQYYQQTVTGEGIVQTILPEDELPEFFVYYHERTGRYTVVTPDGHFELPWSTMNYSYAPETGTYMGPKEVVYGYYAIANRVLYARDVPDSFAFIVEVGDSGFVPEEGRGYLLHGQFLESGTGNRLFALTDFCEGCETPPWQARDEADLSPLFQEYADYYRMANNYIEVEASADVTALEVFQQNILRLSEGRFPEPGETGVCVISGGLDSALGLSVGDTLSLSILTSGEEDRFQLEDTGDVRELTVVGVTTRGEDYGGNVWVSDGEGGFGGALFGYELGRAVLDNAKGRLAADAIQAMAPDNVRVTLYDQGYSAAAQPLETMRTTAMAVTIAAACGTLAVLFLFAYLFVGRQRETVSVLVSLGTPAGKIRLWLLSGAALISGGAALAGAVVSSLVLGRVIRGALSLAQEMYSADQRYSEAAIGVVRESVLSMDTPVWPAAAAGLAVFGVGLALCLFFLSAARRETTPKRGRVKIHAPKSGTSVAGRGPVRFALLSAKRGGWRSAVVPAVALVMTLFLGVLAGDAQTWDSQLDGLYQSAVLGGQVVSSNGRWYAGLSIPTDSLRRLWKSGALEDISMSIGWNYWFDDEMPFFSNTSFGEENRKAWIARQPKLIAVNDLSAAQDFYYDQQPEIEWLEGWDESFLASTEYGSFLERITQGRWSMLNIDTQSLPDYPVLVSRQLMERRGLELGQHVAVPIRFTHSDQDYTVYIGLTVVGVYTQTGADANLYVPLSFWCGPEWVTGEADLLDPGERPNVSFRTEEEREKYYYFATRFETCRFTLKSAYELEDFRDYLAEVDFSAVGRLGKNRITVLLRDQTFTETVGGLNRYIAFGRLLFPVLFALVCVLGFIVSWLMVNGRRMEFAIMRGVGASRGRVFLSFFLEQGLLCLTGCVLGGVLLTLAGTGAVGWLAVGGFLVCYLAGCALSVAAVGRTNLMSLLSERE